MMMSRGRRNVKTKKEKEKKTFSSIQHTCGLFMSSSFRPVA